MVETEKKSSDLFTSDKHKCVGVGDRIYNPRYAELLKIRVLITAHYGKGGHRDTDTTRSQIDSFYLGWPARLRIIILKIIVALYNNRWNQSAQFARPRFARIPTEGIDSH